MSLHAGHTKKYYRERFKDSSDRLFNCAWRWFTAYEKGCIDARNEDEVIRWLKAIMSDLVNNPRSSFYIYGK